MYSSCRAWRPRPSAALQCEKSVAEARETAVLRAAMRLNMEGGGFVGVLGVLGVPGLGRWPNNWWATSERASLRELLLLLAATGHWEDLSYSAYTYCSLLLLLLGEGIRPASE